MNQSNQCLQFLQITMRMVSLKQLEDRAGLNHSNCREIQNLTAVHRPKNIYGNLIGWCSVRNINRGIEMVI